jgi:enoyl-CoA hydratase/carnithine racemase
MILKTDDDAMVFDTLKVRKEGAVLFAEIAAPPMNLLGPELVRDLVSLIKQAEADDALKVLVFKSADPDYFISHVDVTRIKEYREEAAKLTGEASIALLFRHLSVSRLVTIAQIEGRVRGAGSEIRAGVRYALCRARVGDLRPAGAGLRYHPRRGRCPIPRAPHGPSQGARGHVER